MPSSPSIWTTCTVPVVGIERYVGAVPAIVTPATVDGGVPPMGIDSVPPETVWSSESRQWPCCHGRSFANRATLPTSTSAVIRVNIVSSFSRAALAPLSLTEHLIHQQLDDVEFFGLFVGEPLQLVAQRRSAKEDES